MDLIQFEVRDFKLVSLMCKIGFFFEDGCLEYGYGVECAYV